MNDLQVALIVAGVAAVAGVWGFNKWQERRQAQLAQKVFRSEHPDALMGAAGRDAAEESVEAEPMTRREPMLPDADEVAEVRAEVGGLPSLPEQYADEIADCVVRIDFAEPVSAPGLWVAQARWAGHIGKPMSWLGFDEGTGSWKLLSSHDAGHYKVVCAALQLANREGAVSDAELSTFLDGVWELAGQCSGVTGIPKRDDVLMTARNIDDFCASVDLQLGVKIVGANEPLTGPRLKELAEAAGLTLLGDGAFHYIDANGLTRFTLANIGSETFDADSIESLATHGVTLSMDVPRVPDGPAAFDALVEMARPLTEALGGILVDSQGSPLTAEMIATIRAKIAQMQGLMARQQIVAGSVRALRLFS
ncbi:MAG: cell division protein ZipA C-terminal FtsZ-binding domain-containing protein [Gammaproteobacteria bacterium]|nr:cell division protein ZipA C-terminal FtsZ-binding domain-containing protein [Gammaproteobacteria bacterium]MBU1414946.1 cell division protein ZipA C-terminal FtsZ-binding domain-containing protein [Gammaproteobacteria bacterium]